MRWDNCLKEKSERATFLKTGIIACMYADGTEITEETLDDIGGETISELISLGEDWM